MINGVQYDGCGRMKYHPEYHPKQGSPWTNQDEEYLIENYVSDGPEMVAAALGRTLTTIMDRAYCLRKKGAMPKASRQTKKHKRIKL